MTDALERLYAGLGARSAAGGAVAGRTHVPGELFGELRPKLRGQIDIERVFADVVDGLARRFGADRATFYLVDHAARELVSRAAHLPEISEIRLRLGEGIAGWVGQQGEAIRVGERETNTRWSQRIDALTGYRTKSMMVAPVRDNNQLIVGVLQILNRQIGDFTDDDLRDLEAVAHDVASLLDDTSLRAQLVADYDKPLSFRFNFIVGESAAMQEVYERIARAARTDATVLLRGPSGTGKELFARAIHFNSPRGQAPLVKVDCAALPDTLIENELFGHEKGSFTGAMTDADGKVAAADTGTLFLDEIGELPLSSQGKLLRLLQDRSYLRVGGTKPKMVNLRFVCATHRDLAEMVAAGRFREDLYWRLRVVEIMVPPLRERGHVDLDRLLDHFLYEYTRRYERRSLVLSAEARDAVHAYHWPGNVRELAHAIESAVVLSRGPAILPSDLPMHPRKDPGPLSVAAPASEDLFRTEIRPLAEVELDYIRYVLDRCGGSQSAAARALGIGRNTLARKLKEE